MFPNLPPTSIFGKVIPKNAFDQFTNTKQKKMFSDFVNRITWTHKLTSTTTNLKSKDIKEVQVLKIELKSKNEIPQLLNIIDKSIPYHIVFWIQFDGEAYLSVSLKHQNPLSIDLSVIDWTFVSNWFNLNKLPYSLNFKGSIDSIVKDLCVQISGKPELINKPISTIIENQQKIKLLTNEIKQLKAAIKRGRQFNEKVDLNLKLKKVESELSKLLG